MSFCYVEEELVVDTPTTSTATTTSPPKTSATLVHVRRRPEPSHYIHDINRYVVLKYFWMLLLNITGDVDHIGKSYLQVEDIYNLISAFPAMLDFSPF